MKKDNKKALYESIMTSVAKEVKKTLNESWDEYDDNLSEYDNYLNNYIQEVSHYSDGLKKYLQKLQQSERNSNGKISINTENNLWSTLHVGTKLYGSLVRMIYFIFMSDNELLNTAREQYQENFTRVGNVYGENVISALNSLDKSLKVQIKK